MAGKWIVDDEINPRNGSRGYRAALVADPGASSVGRVIVLILQCSRGSTQALIRWNDDLGAEARVTTRLGTAPAEVKTWKVSSDNRASIVSRNTVDFIEALAATNRLEARVTPYRDGPVTAVFDLRGIGTVVQSLRDACGW